MKRAVKIFFIAIMSVFSCEVMSAACAANMHDKITINNKVIEFIAFSNHQPLVLVDGKTKTLKRKQIYWINGEYIKTTASYTSLCFTNQLVTFTPVTSLPEVFPVFSLEENTIDYYIAKYNNHYYKASEFEAIEFQGKKLYLDKKGNYITFDKWIRNKSVIKI